MVKYPARHTLGITITCVTFFLFMLQLTSCSRTNEPIEASKKLHQFATLPEDASQILLPYMDSLQQLENRQPFMDKVANTLGYPLWQYAVIGTQNGHLTILAPLVKKNGSKVSGLIALKRDTKFTLRIFDAEHPEKYGFSNKRKTANARSVFIAADLFNQRAFELDPAAINDPCLMLGTERLFLKNARRTDEGVKPVLMARGLEGYIETCYYTTVCMPDASGNCIGEMVIHRDCILSSIWVDDSDTGGQEYYEFPDDGLHAGGSGGSGQTPGTSNDCYGILTEEEINAAPAVLPPSRPITNVTKYLSCFTTGKGAIISFFADQPLAGSTDPYTMKEKVGHAFLAIEQFDNGRIVRRSLGYHPRDAVSPFLTKSSESILGDDSNEPYDVRLDVSVTPAILEKVLNLIQNYSPTYHIENYNCTNFVLDVADACGVQIKRTKGSWVIGSGLNPANFGEDLKKIPGAVSSGGKSKENVGSCN